MRAISASRARVGRQGPFGLNEGAGPRSEFFWSPGGRLTLTSGVPVTTADVTGAATLFYTEHEHAFLPLFDGRRFAPTELPYRTGTTSRELALSLAGVSSGSLYDVFAKIDSGRARLFLGPTWSSTTARAAAIARLLGRWTLAADPRALYLGTVYGSGAGTVDDAHGSRFVWNACNRVRRGSATKETTDSWATSGTNSTWAAVNGGAAVWKHSYVLGLDECLLEAIATVVMAPAAGPIYPSLAVALDGTTPDRSQSNFAYYADGSSSPVTAFFSAYPGIGLHYAQAVETTSTVGAASSYGDNGGGAPLLQSNMASWASG